MEPIELIRRTFKYLCLHPFDEKSSVGKKIGCIIFGSAVFSSNVYALITSVDFFIEFLSIDVEECLFALFQIFGYIGVTYASVVIFLQQNAVREIFQQLSQIYKNRMCHEIAKKKNFILASIVFLRLCFISFHLFINY